MSSKFGKGGLRLAMFAVATSLSLIFTSALLHNPLGRDVVGLLLIGGLLLAILYLFAKYLKVLWLLSDKVSAVIIGRIPKPVAIPATQAAQLAELNGRQKLNVQQMQQMNTNLQGVIAQK